jgi:hypothetical protein
MELFLFVELEVFTPVVMNSSNHVLCLLPASHWFLVLLFDPEDGNINVSRFRTIYHVISHNTELYCFFSALCYDAKIFSVDIDLYGPPLWSSGQSSWLQIRRPGFDSRH